MVALGSITILILFALLISTWIARRATRDIAHLKSSYSVLEEKNAELARELGEALAERSELQNHLALSQKMDAFAQVAAGVAHDFNNILAIVIGNGELAESLLEKPQNHAEVRRLIKEISDAADRGADLTRQLLTIARRQSDNPRVTDVNEVLRDQVLDEQAKPALPKGHREKILICEDNDAVRLMAARILEKGGYDVVATAEAAEAIRLIATADFRLLITDVVMPEMDGGELVETVRKLKHQLPVLFVSGYTAGVLVSYGISEESLNFLRKPFRASILLERVQALMETESKAQS